MHPDMVAAKVSPGLRRKQRQDKPFLSSDAQVPELRFSFGPVHHGACERFAQYRMVGNSPKVLGWGQQHLGNAYIQAQPHPGLS